MKSRHYGVCEKCGKETDYPGIFLLALDWEKGGKPFFYCDCGGKAYLHTDPDVSDSEFKEHLKRAAEAKPQTMEEMFETISKQKFKSSDTILAPAPCRERTQPGRCGRCHNCLELEKVKERVLACCNPPFSHADDDVVELWNKELARLPCTREEDE